MHCRQSRFIVTKVFVSADKYVAQDAESCERPPRFAIEERYEYRTSMARRDGIRNSRARSGLHLGRARPYSRRGLATSSSIPRLEYPRASAQKAILCNIFIHRDNTEPNGAPTKSGRSPQMVISRPGSTNRHCRKPRMNNLSHQKNGKGS